jgi:hypothetical protein
MVTGTRARSYQEMVDALAEEGLPALQNTLSGLAPEDWERSTLLQPPDPDKPRWTVLQLAAHFDVFMGLTMGLVAEPMEAQPVVDRASFYISVSDRSKVSPVIYQLHRRPRPRAHLGHDPRQGRRDVQAGPGGDQDHPVGHHRARLLRADAAG